MFGRLYKSIDGGASWSTASGQTPNTYIRGLAIDPITPSTLYAGFWQAAHSRAPIAARAGTLHSSGLTNTDVRRSDRPNGAQHALRRHGGRCVQRARIVAPAGSPATPGLCFPGSYCLSDRSRDRRTLYVGKHDGVFKSTDSGGNWNRYRYRALSLFPAWEVCRSLRIDRWNR